MKNEIPFSLNIRGIAPVVKRKDILSQDSWLRDYFKCTNCDSIPRECALMLTIERQYPNWKELAVHESSPSNRGHSIRLKKQAGKYTESQFFMEEPRGKRIKGIRNEDLENQTFADAVFDLVITADVMEHVFEPKKAFKEIHRTLKPGGAHIFSVPLVNKHLPSQRWATKGQNGEPNFLYSEEWHGNPINKKGSPVKMHWGYDIKDFIKKQTGANCSIEYIDDLNFGIRAEYIEIIVAKKNL
ncbi:MAG: class I SAM-dependent methyltransferase [Bacteroidota bacterium]